ncbi:TetR/AcrR family transcriptional regulator [Trebonia kvetii]|uniref:TetR/AcrR family transcriptional regulator n=1 Tax=Trebonia kvetii TaxID=2480626 RepID=A0A6P2BVH7_9ACTN|nr:TetR/AcrR family transcriptional regulator [Trebonia kvetii]TVZ02145.1 TetR/AcrR family transcriptional regulator [Trebonia kvetii]
MTEPQDRRELIVATAAEMFARKGIRSTTVREIADSVGVLSGSLYHYFSSKDEIVKEILMGFLAAIQDRYGEVLAQGQDASQTLRAVVLASLRVAKQQPDATVIYQNELRYLRETPQYKEVQAAAADVQRVWAGVIERGVADGTFRDDISPRIFHRLIRDAVWLSGRGQHSDAGYSTERLADAITSIFLQGFAARPGIGASQSDEVPAQTP